MDSIVKGYDGVCNTYNIKHLTEKGFEHLKKSLSIGKYYKEGKIKTVNAILYTSFVTIH